MAGGWWGGWMGGGGGGGRQCWDISREENPLPWNLIWDNQNLQKQKAQEIEVMTLKSSILTFFLLSFFILNATFISVLTTIISWIIYKAAKTRHSAVKCVGAKSCRNGLQTETDLDTYVIHDVWTHEANNGSKAGLNNDVPSSLHHINSLKRLDWTNLHHSDTALLLEGIAAMTLSLFDLSALLRLIFVGLTLFSCHAQYILLTSLECRCKHKRDSLVRGVLIC